MNTQYLLCYRYIDDNPQGEYDIDQIYQTQKDAAESAQIYKANALNPIIIKIIKRKYKDEEIETI